MVLEQADGCLSEGKEGAKGPERRGSRPGVPFAQEMWSRIPRDRVGAGYGYGGYGG